MRHLFKLIPIVIGIVGVLLLTYRYGSRELFLVVMCFTIMTPLVYLMVDRYAQQAKLLALKEEALRAELGLLKSQIDPHFFFNTLNNMYGLAVTKSDKAPELILKLSDLMRFTIYEGKKDRVLLRDEIAYLKNYLDVQLIRTKLDKVDLRFDVDVADDLVSVPPLMYMMLIENAIKHGVSTLTEGAFLHVRLSGDEKVLDFEVSNNYEREEGKRPGIGLRNLNRRLELLFPGRHAYETRDVDGVYKAHLRLEL